MEIVLFAAFHIISLGTMQMFDLYIMYLFIKVNHISLKNAG